MSEYIAYERYVEHTKQCSECRPQATYLCKVGWTLHQSWKAAEFAERPLTRKMAAAARR